jgi:hypothetical protein
MLSCRVRCISAESAQVYLRQRHEFLAFRPSSHLPTFPSILLPYLALEPVHLNDSKTSFPSLSSLPRWQDRSFPSSFVEPGIRACAFVSVAKVDILFRTS